MSTLNEIVTALAASVNQKNNFVLKQRLKDSFKGRLANRLRQDVTRNGGTMGYSLSFSLPLSRVDFADDCNIDIECDVLRTTAQVPRPVRLKKNPFIFVGTSSGHSFTREKYWTVEDRKFARYIGDKIFYDYINRYIYIFNNLKLKKIRIDAIFPSPDLIAICTGDDSVADCYSDDSEFPAPDDMIESIKDEIREKELLKIRPQEEVDTKIEIETEAK